MELNQSDHGKPIATALRLAGRNRDNPILIELTNKGVITHGGKQRQTFVRFNQYIDLPDTPIIVNGGVVREILQLSKRVELSVNENEVILQNGCTWKLTNRAGSRSIFITDPVWKIARIPFNHLRQAIEAGYKRAYKPSQAVIIVGGKYELSCRDLETFLKVKEVKIQGDEMELSVYLCENNTIRYGIHGVWVATVARRSNSWNYQHDSHGKRLVYSYWTNIYGSWQGHITIQDAWREIRRFRNNSYEGSVTLRSFFGFEKTWTSE